MNVRELFIGRHSDRGAREYEIMEESGREGGRNIMEEGGRKEGRNNRDD